MTNITGFSDIFQFNNSKINIITGELQNCLAENFKIFSIYNSSFSLENTLFLNFNSLIIYSSSGFIRIDRCIFNNFNSSDIDNDYDVIMFELNVSFIINNSLFKYLIYSQNSVKFKVFIKLYIFLKFQIGPQFAKYL